MSRLMTLTAFLVSCFMTQVVVAQLNTQTVVSVVTYKSGRFEMPANGKWTEYTNAGAQNNFVERERNQSYIRLFDSARNIEILLNLQMAEVQQVNSGKPAKRLHGILHTIRQPINNQLTFECPKVRMLLVNPNFEGDPDLVAATLGEGINRILTRRESALGKLFLDESTVLQLIEDRAYFSSPDAQVICYQE